MKEIITRNFKETQQLGKKMAGEIEDGKIICLTGELGSGKTTFAQGLLKGLGVKGPYTSPTFVVMKEYRVTCSTKQIKNIYHVDAYRVNSNDILNLGWEEIVSDKNNVIIIEWADRIKNIIPKNAVWINFEWIDENKRSINFK